MPLECCNTCDCFCDAPANSEEVTRCHCFRCGLPTCKSCSIITTYRPFRQKRLCHDCLRDQGFDLMVMEHLYRLGGYKDWKKRAKAHVQIAEKKAS